MIKRKLVAAALFCSAAVMAIAPSVAQAFPTKPIRLVVPFSPGGGTDILARQLADQLSKQEGWNIVVDNRPGGNGTIALSTVSRAAADGHEIILALRENIVITPLLNGTGGAFDPLKDFTAIANVADSPMIIVTGADSKLKNINDVLNIAKKDPEALRFGTSGQGSMSHLLLAMLEKTAGAGMIHVPYKGSNPALTDMVGGHVELVGGSIGSAKSFLDGGRAKAMAVSSLERVPAYPNVPTIAEQGYPGFNVVTWYGLFGPKGVPQEAIDTINAAVNKVLANPQFQETLSLQGMRPVPGTPQEFDSMFRADYADLESQLKTLNM